MSPSFTFDSWICGKTLQVKPTTAGYCNPRVTLSRQLTEEASPEHICKKWKTPEDVDERLLFEGASSIDDQACAIHRHRNSVDVQRQRLVCNPETAQECVGKSGGTSQLQSIALYHYFIIIIIIIAMLCSAKEQESTSAGMVAYSTVMCPWKMPCHWPSS